VVGAGEGGGVGASLNGLSLREPATYSSVGDAVGVPVSAVGANVGAASALCTTALAVGSGVGDIVDVASVGSAVGSPVGDTVG